MITIPHYGGTPVGWLPWQAGASFPLYGPGGPAGVGASTGTPVPQAVTVQDAYVVVLTSLATGESVSVQLHKSRANGGDVAVSSPVTIDSNFGRGDVVHLPLDAGAAALGPGDWLYLAVTDCTLTDGSPGPADWSFVAEVA